MNRRLEKILAAGGRKIKTASTRPRRGAFLPRELHLELTYRCNQECVMCDIWPRSRGEGGLPAELSQGEIEKAVENSRILDDLEMILLTGGEPFLRSDLVDLAVFFLRRYPRARLMILSNFFATGLIEKKIRAILDAAPAARLSLGTSLDGLDETHDRVRAVDGAFAALIKTVRMVKTNFPAIPVESNFTLTPANHAQLLPAYRFARQMGMGFTAQFPISWPGTPSFKWRGKDLDKVEDAVSLILEDIYRRSPRPGGIVTPDLLSRLYYWKGLVEYQRQPRRVFASCPASHRYVMLSPAGDLYFCPKLKNMVVGNILQTPLDDLWRGEKSEKIRRMIDSGGCHCWLNCTTYFALSETFSRAGISSRLLRTGFYRGGTIAREGRRRAAALASAAVQTAVYSLTFPYLFLRVLAALFRRRLHRSGF